MSPTTISLARLLELDVPRAWHEIVAVVLEAAQAMQQAGTAAGAGACVIDSTGELHIEGGGRVGNVEAAVRSLLAAMLEGQGAPAELKGLVASSAAPRTGGLDALIRSLAYFERPDRKAAIASLASRALATTAQADAVAELVRRRSGAPSTDAPKRPGASQTGRRRHTGLATILLLAAVAASAFWYLNRQAPPVESPAVASEDAAATGTAAPTLPSKARSIVTAAREAMASAADAGLRAIGLAPASEPEASPATPPAAPSSVPRRAPRGPAEPPARAVEVDPATDAPSDPAPSEAVLPIAAAEPEESVMPPEPPPGPYTEADMDVEPPVLVYPQLRSEPSAAPPATVPHFELLVNERGEVDQVRLRARDARFQDRMMISAAKAWRFRPATKDGTPVRYRVRVPIPR